MTTNLGNAPGNVTIADRVNPEYWRYSFGIERQFPGDFLVEISYLGQRGRHLPILETVNYVPEQFRTQSPIRDVAAETFLSQVVSNPFVGLTPDSPGIERRHDRAPPAALSASAVRGERHLHRHRHVLHRDGQRVERLSRDDLPRGQAVHARVHVDELVHLVAHARAVTPLNPWEEPEERVAAVDRPHRITFASVAELPVGRDRRWGGDWSPAVDAILGGWQFSAKFEWQIGQPLVFNNNTYFDPACGDPKDLKAQWGKDGSGVFRGVDAPVMDVTCFYTLQNQPFRNAAGQPVTFQATEIQLGQPNIRTFPTTMPNVRFMNHHLLDFGLTKNFRVGDRVRVQVRIEALNATNYTLFGSGNVTLTSNQATFMMLNNIDSSTVMKPRDIQIGARVTF